MCPLKPELNPRPKLLATAHRHRQLTRIDGLLSLGLTTADGPSQGHRMSAELACHVHPCLVTCRVGLLSDCISAVLTFELGREQQLDLF